MDTTKIEFGHEHDVQKRYFLKKTLQLGVVSGIASMAFLSDCKEEEKEDVSPPRRPNEGTWYIKQGAVSI